MVSTLGPKRSDSAPTLFYSYCHEDAKFRDQMEDCLALLRQRNQLNEWWDQKILPGRNIRPNVRMKMREADIIVFLLSRDFLASSECMCEWEYAKDLANDDEQLFRIPIIIRDCDWRTLLEKDDLMALPCDARPVDLYEHEDTAWREVGDGIVRVLEEIMASVSAKSDFLENIEKTVCISKTRLNIRDLFVFPRLQLDEVKKEGSSIGLKVLSSMDNLLESQKALIRGPEKSGKSTLAKFAYLSLLDSGEFPLLIEMRSIGPRPHANVVKRQFERQWNGSFAYWTKRPQKTLIVDDVERTDRFFEFLDYAESKFERVVLVTSDDQYAARFRGEKRVALYESMRIESLTFNQQEELIKKRVAKLDAGLADKDGFIDQVEATVDSVIVSARILPRYPFYVMAILQTFEDFMPSNVSVTSHGHCYHALIVASLMRAGVSNTDDEVNSCFNFVSRLAFAKYIHELGGTGQPLSVERFEREYARDYIIDNRLLQKLRDREFGLLTEDGKFRSEFIYHYFLGKYLAENLKSGAPILNRMCDESYEETNFLTILFAIHHAKDDGIINEIAYRSMDELNAIESAKLTPDETKRFRRTIRLLSRNILSGSSVDEGRKKEREGRQRLADKEKERNDGEPEDDVGKSILKILKNNKILSQVLRNRYGMMTIPDIEDVVEVICEGGLRLVNALLKDEDEIADLARYISSKHPEWDFDEVKRALELWAFVWTVGNVSLVVDCVNVPRIRRVVQSVVDRNDTPAYDVIGYINDLSCAHELTHREMKKLEVLLDKHGDEFVRMVVSAFTQHYMNTHRNRVSVEQSVCALLGIEYRHRFRK